MTLLQIIVQKCILSIKSIYTVVKYCVRFTNTYSDFFNCDIGLMQGDTSSHLMFMLFVSDIIQKVNANKDDIFSLNEHFSFLILYADDQVLFAMSTDSLC